MRKFALAFAAFSLSVAAHGGDLKPMSAIYAVTRNGQPLGDSTFALKPNPDGSWTLTSETKGTAGMARLINADVREESILRWNNGKAESLRYNYVQDTTIKVKKKHIDFDTSAKQARSQDGKDNYTYAIPAGTLDRAAVQLVLADAIARGLHEITVPVAARDHVERQHYVVTGTETINVPAGSFKTTKIERVDEPGKGKAWYSSSLSGLPVRVEQISGDNATVVLELKQR